MNMEKFSAGLQQGLSSILERRKSKDSGQSSEEPAYESLPEIGVDFEVEEEQVMKGLELLYQDRLSEADEYFETLKTGHARFSLHHAEVASFIALMSFEPEDIEFATTLLTETVSLADQQAKRWRTHSNLKKVNEAVGAMKTWALTRAATALKRAGPVGAQASAKLMPVESPSLPADDDDDEGSSSKPSNREEATYNHRARRMRLWALLIQGECHLMTSLLQVVAAGESWTSMVKVGFNAKRCWSIYQHCQKKLDQLQKEWVSLGGTLTGTGPMAPGVQADSDSDEDPNGPELNFDPANAARAMALAAAGPSRSSRRSQNYDPELSAPEGEMIYQGVRAAAGNLERLEGGIKEDQELASLRIGIQFGIGAFNLMISLIPTNYQKAIELMAVPGDRNQGLSLLRKVSGLHHSRAPLAAIVLLNYFTVLMGLLPYTQEHAMGGRNVLQMLPIAWKESSVFRVMQARLASYETQLEEATAMIVKCLRNPVKSKGSEGIPMQRLANLILDEHGWYLLLQGDFTGAYENFSSLYKDTVWLKPLYACLMAACCWEADDKFHNEAAKLMRDLPGMISGKKTNPTPMENFALRLANDFITNGQAPLFPAMEIIAVYNGFQHMDKATLKRHLDRIGDALMTRSPRRASDYQNVFSKEEPHQPGGSEQSGGPPSYADVMKKDVPGEAVAGQRNIPFQSRSKSSSPKSEDDDDSSSSGSKFHHTWAKGSKVLCRYLLALCQRSLGDLKQAEANFRYVVSQTDVVPGNVVPYACFEWGSMLLSSESTSPEGLNLLEKSIDFPSHEFQTRLKFVVSERLRMFRRACENDLSSKASTTSALNLRRVSELLRTVQIQPK
ncbi:tetratricopeptide repeat protein 39 [Marchantia polymorpha subsp. ruderalis]|uniref:Uncharacterized protein n=2 Tax=Marchantia polymorpha TaxID=3197 RepID=A0AAF6AQQ7_MARPO|nr:hypothetical protein MARPO_0033s0044 [Marchantia polymorpha]BBM98777.1 hypothetical protein Mp_1g16160 [Marchantia polymorpha subsp. ruderalis]|eukprot:PTQ41626.1 hypothetical protein MARPO_0033s0044 [Marchantia polymorpha]